MEDMSNEEHRELLRKKSRFAQCVLCVCVCVCVSTYACTYIPVLGDTFFYPSFLLFYIVYCIVLGA